MKRFYNNKVLETFFILQPIIDIITGIMLHEFTLALSLGMIIRFLFLIYASIYILINKNKHSLVFIILGIIYIITSCVGNYYIKDGFNIISHLKDLLHIIYLPIVTLFFYTYFKSHKKLNNKIFSYIGIIVGLSLILSVLTKTSYCTYSEFTHCYSKGYLGWFNSGNEYGIVLTALLGYQLINFFKDKNILNFYSLCFIVLFLSILGTKTSFMALASLLIFFSVYELVKTYFEKSIKDNLVQIGVVLLLIIAVGISLTKLPVYYNMEEIYKEAKAQAYQKYVIENNNDANDESTITAIDKKVQATLVFNGRDEFIILNKQMYKEAPLFNKLFGMTLQGNKVNGIPYNHTNERDFHDLYMYYGIFGLILELLVPLSITIATIKNAFKNFRKFMINDEVIILIVTALLIGVTSYMAGHLVTQPAPCIYFAYILNMILKESRKTA